MISKFLSKEKDYRMPSAASTKLRNTFSNTIQVTTALLAHKRMISCLIPDIHSPMSSVCEPLVSRSTWIPSAASRSCAAIAKSPISSANTPKNTDREHAYLG